MELYVRLERRDEGAETARGGARMPSVRRGGRPQVRLNRMALWHGVQALAAMAFGRPVRPSSADLANMVSMLETEGEQVVGAALALGAARYAPGVMPLVALLENP